MVSVSCPSKTRTDGAAMSDEPPMSMVRGFGATRDPALASLIDSISTTRSMYWSMMPLSSKVKRSVDPFQ